MRRGKEPVIVDTSIWVDLLRGNSDAETFLLGTSPLIVSRVTVLELIHGVPSRRNIPLLKRQLDALRATVTEVNERISELAGSLYEKHCHADGIGIIDAFIAATTIDMNEQLATHNTKHFKAISHLSFVVPY